MDSVPAKAFLSQVFDPRMEDSLNRIKAICKALDIETVWVDRAASETPSTVAAEKIDNADFLIAVCSQKMKLDGKEKYLTSTAVREEIAIAKAKNKNIVCFMEKDVEADGFSGNMFTYSILENASALTANDLFDITQGVHSTKLKSISKADDVIHATGIRNFYLSDFVMRIELIDSSGGYFWEYIIEKTFQFEAEHDYPITHSAFCLESEISKASPTYQIEYTLNGAATIPTVSEKNSPGSIELRSKFDPPLKKGDVLFSRERYRSPWLVPVHAGQDIQYSIDLNGQVFNSYDGICVINRIQNLKLIYAFPKGYEPKNIQPLVATFSWVLDHVNQSEVDRIKKDNCFKLEQFDGRTTATLCIDRPLYQYFYGLAWKLPAETQLTRTVASAAPAWE